MEYKDIFCGEDGQHLKEIVDRVRKMKFGKVVITKYSGRIASVDYTDERRFLSKRQLRGLKEDANVKSKG